MKIGTLTTGVGVQTTISLNYLPQFLYYIAATALTALKVDVEGDGTICDLDAQGLKTMNEARRYGRVTNSYLINLADGIVPNKTVTITFTNSAAQTPEIYGFSLKKASVYVKSQMVKCLAGSQVSISKFAYLGFGTAFAAGDNYLVRMGDDTLQRFDDPVELQGLITLYSNITEAAVIDNVGGYIKEVLLVPAADAIAYKMSYVIVGSNLIG